MMTMGYQKMDKTKRNKINFNPKIRYYELEYLAGSSFTNEKEIRNNFIYNIIKRLSNKAFPSYEDKYDKKWFYFYIPLKRAGKLISLPFWVIEYNKEFFLGFQGLGRLHIKKGKNKIENEYKEIFKETLRFIPFIKKETRILDKTIPYDIRTGKIKGKHIMKNILSKKEKEKFLRGYEKHAKKQLNLYQISLNDYLRVCAVCYKAAYKNKARTLSPVEMYKKWADGRDAGMLSIENKNSKNDFNEWLNGGKSAGGHPFEIVFSWFNHGIHLYPPREDRRCFMLTVTNYTYVFDFIKMVKALIKEQIPFEARDIKEVLAYLCGETYFSVNEYGEHFFSYIPSKEYRKKYFKRVEWDKIEVVRFK